MIRQFDFLENISQRNILFFFIDSLRIKLNEFKIKNPSSTDAQLKQKQLDELEKVYEYMALLQREKELAEKMSFESNLINLQLMNRVKLLEEENIKLNKVLKNT